MSKKRRRGSGGRHRQAAERYPEHLVRMGLKRGHGERMEAMHAWLVDPAHGDAPGDIGALLDLADATDMINELSADRHDLVEEARAAGHTWATIAHALGITTQGAQKRYGAPSELL